MSNKTAIVFKNCLALIMFYGVLRFNRQRTAKLMRPENVLTARLSTRGGRSLVFLPPLSPSDNISFPLFSFSLPHSFIHFCCPLLPPLAVSACLCFVSGRVESLTKTSDTHVLTVICLWLGEGWLKTLLVSHGNTETVYWLFWSLRPYLIFYEVASKLLSECEGKQCVWGGVWGFIVL